MLLLLVEGFGEGIGIGAEYSLLIPCLLDGIPVAAALLPCLLLPLLDIPFAGNHAIGRKKAIDDRRNGSLVFAV